MTRLFCIDGDFTNDQKQLLDYWPLEGEEYTLREEVTYPSGRVGYHLNEIYNSPITYLKTNTTGEPSFSIKRFVVLGDPIEETVTDELKNQ